jgi:hypothetical protein
VKRSKTARARKQSIQRVQSGVRLERSMLKVLKALAEYMDLSLAELLELIVLQSFEDAPGFSAGTVRRIQDLKRIYEMQYDLSRARMTVFTER